MDLLSKKWLALYCVMAMFVVGVITILGCFTNVFAYPKAGGCVIDVNKDLNATHPLILYKNKNEYILPHPDGGVRFKTGEIARLVCTGKDNVISVLGKATAEAKCKSGNIFTVGTNSYSFLDLQCNDFSKPSARRTGQKCLGKYTEIEMGYQITANEFIRDLISCFDDKNSNVLYSVFNLTKTINQFQSKLPRPYGFDEADFYPGLKPKPSQLYTKKEQTATLARLLKSEELAKKYIHMDDDFYMARGHLTANADFIYGTQQRSTFFYVNVAPQWQSFNAKNWMYLESNVRNYASKKKKDLIVITGTYGIAELPDVNGNPTQLYLYVAANGTVSLPVPMVYWKIAYNPEDKKAIGFVAHNNPYDEEAPEKMICTDICDQIDWLTWDATSIQKGYGYCCDVHEMKKIIDFIPDFPFDGVLT